MHKQALFSLFVKNKTMFFGKYSSAVDLNTAVTDI